MTNFLNNTSAFKVAIPAGSNDQGISSSILSSQQIAGQSFEVYIYGLNIRTDLNVYIDGVLVSTSNIQPYTGQKGGNLQTDGNGNVSFYVYFSDPVPNIKNVPEADFINALKRNTKLLNVVVVDRASINGSSLPDNFRTIARCYAEQSINRTYETTFNVVRDVIDTRTNSKSTTTLGSQTLLT